MEFITGDRQMLADSTMRRLRRADAPVAVSDGGVANIKATDINPPGNDGNDGNDGNVYKPPVSSETMTTNDHAPTDFDRVFRAAGGALVSIWHPRGVSRDVAVEALADVARQLLAGPAADTPLSLGDRGASQSPST